MNYLKSIISAPKDGRFILLAKHSGYISTPLSFTEGRWIESYDDWLDAGNNRLSGEGEIRYWMELPIVATELDSFLLAYGEEKIGNLFNEIYQELNNLLSKNFDAYIVRGSLEYEADKLSYPGGKRSIDWRMTINQLIHFLYQKQSEPSF